jgi:hypothetical protein
MQDFHMAADALVQALPNAHKIVVRDAGHLARLEQAQTFRELLLTVLSDRAEGRDGGGRIRTCEG